MCSLPECWGGGKLCKAESTGISTWAPKNVASLVESESEAKNTATTFSTFVAHICSGENIHFHLQSRVTQLHECNKDIKKKKNKKKLKFYISFLKCTVTQFHKCNEDVPKRQRQKFHYNN